MYRQEFKNYNDKQEYIKQIKKENSINYGFILDNKILVKCQSYEELKHGLFISNSVSKNVTLVIQ